MTRELFRYRFDADVAFEDVEAALVLSLLACECLHGEVETRLHAKHAADAAKRACVVDVSTEVGRDLAKLFTGFVRHEIPERCFTVSHMDAGDATPDPSIAV